MLKVVVKVGSIYSYLLSYNKISEIADDFVARLGINYMLKMVVKVGSIYS